MPVMPIQDAHPLTAALPIAGNGGRVYRNGVTYEVRLVDTSRPNRRQSWEMRERQPSFAEPREWRPAIVYTEANDWQVLETSTEQDDMPSTTWDRDCDHCGITIDTLNDYYYYCDDCDNYSCDECGECSSYSDCGDSYYDLRYRVHSWDYKPDYMPKGGGPVFLGVELEIGGSAGNISEAVHSVDNDEAHLYMKDDGSIDGVEIVTHPATLEWSKNFPFTSMLDNLRQRGCFVNSGYGLHVHVARSGFTPSKQATHQMRWLMFLYRNVRELELIARRPDNRWSRFRAPVRGELARKAKRHYGDDRYVAVNCNNTATYELRFFKSTMDPQEFFTAMEFADASVEYTRMIKAPEILKGNALSWDRFTTWVASRSDTYSHLAAELEDIKANREERASQLEVARNDYY